MALHQDVTFTGPAECHAAAAESSMLMLLLLLCEPQPEADPFSLRGWSSSFHYAPSCPTLEFIGMP
jgi:hypothetical protein